VTLGPTRQSGRNLVFNCKVRVANIYGS